MNISFIIGRLTQKPQEVQGTQTSLCKMTLAVNENYTNKDGERPVQFINVVVWGKLADNCIKYLDKGSQIAVLGKLQTRSWNDENGVKKYAFEIVASEVEFLSKAKNGDSQQVTNDDEPKLIPIDDDDLPF